MTRSGRILVSALAFVAVTFGMLAWYAVLLASEDTPRQHV